MRGSFRPTGESDELDVVAERTIRRLDVEARLTYPISPARVAGAAHAVLARDEDLDLARVFLSDTRGAQHDEERDYENASYLFLRVEPVGLALVVQHVLEERVAGVRDGIVLQTVRVVEVLGRVG